MTAMTGPPAQILAATEGETIDVLSAPFVVKADPAAAGFLLAEHIVPPGFGVPPHVHAVDDEVFYMLEGELTVADDAGEHRIGPGATALLPAGGRHAFRNDGPAPARFLVMVRPGLQTIEMFREFERRGRAAGGSLPPAEIVAICAAHGVTMG